MSEVPIDTSEASWKFTVAFARLAVGITFLFAALVKLGDLPGFATDVRDYELLPELWTNAVAYVFPWIEAIAALLLITGIWRREARVLIATMLVGFVVLKLIVLIQQRDVDCGCFGGTILSRVFSGIPGLVLNLALLGCLGLECFGRQRHLHGAGVAQEAGVSHGSA
ncbi:MAG: DoxX family membrane protein [Planctomycetes bacterium]|nr:DoxX family membrane protein [Planctomycetota bacterium]